MRRGIALIASLALLGLAVLPSTANADVNDFTVTDFSADETLSRADPQGQLHIVERINVDFRDYNHGIIRAIPDRYNGHPLQFHLNSVTSDTQAPTTVSKSSENDNVMLKIGDAARTVTGPQEYTIDYTLSNVVSFYKDHVELYWDVNGDQWSQTFDHVSVTLHSPAGVLQTDPTPRRFAGGYGSTSTNCTVETSADTLHATANSLGPHSTLTYVAALRSGYFTAPTWWDRLNEYKSQIIAVLLLPALVFGTGLVWWLRSGRDAPGRGTIVPEYQPPEGLLPIEAGMVADFTADYRDFTATYLDLARRGYIRIIENRKDRVLLKDKLTYDLQLTKSDLSALNPIEISLLSSLFDKLELNDVVSMQDKKNKLYKTVQSLRTDVAKSLTVRGYFRMNPSKFLVKLGTLLTMLYVLAFLVGGPLAGAGATGPFFLAGLVLALVIGWLFWRVMPARTALGTETREKLLGLKMYMETAEKDRMKLLEAPGAPYAAGAGQPSHTVEFFETLLPYAVVLGVEKQWAEKFNDIYTSPPDWYNGNWTAFNAGYLAGSLNEGFVPAMSAGFTAPSSSGSSGFGGGGFSGGGGGGGGGGGW